MFAKTMQTRRAAQLPGARLVFTRASPQNDAKKAANQASTAAEDAAGQAKGVLEDAKDAVSQATANSPSPPERVRNTLEPRVNELRNEQLPGESDWFEVMKFAGPGPELANARLAMLGFTSAMFAELNTHQTVLQQIKDAPWSVFIASAAIAIATIGPMLSGSVAVEDVDNEGKPFAWNYTNELINGRAAMLGFALVIGWELYSKSPMFP